ncbi:MAG: uncharacterized membrane protein YgdD (TMEM256/DUF423 family) [Polaribacter sp.]|jgi:uncharacterized membrane protein YgdD (TMEM256/DUF423 family)
MSKNFLRLAFLFALLAVVFGAFGAHALKKVLSEYQLGIFDTGVRYQFYHALGLVAAFLLKDHMPEKFTRWAAYCFALGILLFSGSLYLLACSEVIGLENKSIVGPMTPIGGLFFILGWGSLLLGSFKGDRV